MGYEDTKVPFLGEAAIKKAADAFREKYWNASVPVEIERIIAFDLKIDIIPLPNLMKLCNGDAFITSNWKCIYIDNDKYLDERYENRLRFSLAHEMGHFILHKHLYQTFGIKELTDFYEFINGVPADQYGYLEIQAHKFASHLLIPREELVRQRQRAIDEAKAKGLSGIDSETLNPYIAIPLSLYFGVSEEGFSPYRPAA